jgi:hypothetical protein
MSVVIIVNSGQSFRRVNCVQRRDHDEVSDSIDSQKLLWLCDGEISGTQEEERPPWEVGTRGLEGQQTKRINYMYSELHADCTLCV